MCAPAQHYYEQSNTSSTKKFWEKITLLVEVLDWSDMYSNNSFGGIFTTYVGTINIALQMLVQFFIMFAHPS